ncbi:MAG: hypothetical protein U0835_24825 [Isosphaeraceae bacterium]
MYAIFERELGRLTFAGAISPGFLGSWQPGVSLAPLPCDLYALPRGADWPERVVGVSLDDHSLYRVFSFASDMGDTCFRSTGLVYGGTFKQFPPGSPAKFASQANGPERLLVPEAAHGEGDPEAMYRGIVALYGVDMVRAACSIEGFDASKTERVMTLHLQHSQRLDLAELVAKGVASHVRRLARGLEGR